MSYELHRHDALHISQLLEPESVDLIITSPPYFALRSYRDDGAHYDGQLGSESTPGEFVDNLIACTADWLRVLKPTGSLWVNLGDKYSQRTQTRRSSHQPGFFPGRFEEFSETWAERAKAGAVRMPHQNIPGPGLRHIPEKSLMGLPWRYAIRCIDELGLILRAEVIWSKPNGLPESVTDRVRRSHEQWFHFTREGRYFAAVDEVREPQLFTGGEGSHHQQRLSGNGVTHREYTSNKEDYNPLGKVPGSVWTVEDADDAIHSLLEAVAAGALDADEAARLLHPDIERSHEQWFHFVRSPRYFAAVDDVREESTTFVTDTGTVRYRRVGDPAATENVSGGNSRRYAARGEGDGKGFPIAYSNPLGEVPGSVWSIPPEPLQVPDHLGVDHFAAFPSELPRRIILGWSPTGYCTACGEARRAVVDRTRDVDFDHIEPTRGPGAANIVFQNSGPWSKWLGSSATITGYTCACPDTAAPTTPAVVLDPFAGTGTVPAVAHLLGRHGIGTDLSNDYLRLAEWRCTSDQRLRDKVLDRTGIPNPEPPKIDGQMDLFGEAM